MTYDDPFVIRTNIARFQSLLQSEIDEPTRRIVCLVLAEYEAMAAPRDQAGEAIPAATGTTA